MYVDIVSIKYSSLLFYGILNVFVQMSELWLLSGKTNHSFK